MSASVGVRRQLVPPDGGWGWAVAGAFSIYFFLVFSFLASFGLIYKSEFKRLNFTGTQSSLIVSTNGGVCMLCGLINGSLLNKFGTRKVSVCSSILIVIGLLMTAYSTTFTQFMIAYGLITSIGIGMGMSSYSLALNTYFSKRRTKVTGYSTALYGVGTILFPQLVSFLLANFSVADTMLIITSIFGNTLVAALLLQPVKWHMKVEELPYDKTEPDEATNLFNDSSKENEEVKGMCNDVGTIHASMSSLNLHLKSTALRYDKVAHTKNTSFGRRMLQIIVKAFDLTLLADCTFLNILVGLSIDFFVEFNYLWLIPFILMESNLTVGQTATFMSVYGVADILFRLLAPYIGSILKKSNRVMYIISLILVVIARTLFPYFTNYVLLLFVSVCMGGFRGMRLVYWSLVVPEYTPTERLASAFGLLFTFNGLYLFLGGPILGLLRDASGNYKTCVIFLNSITLTTVAIWTAELVYKRINSCRIQQRENITA